MESVSRPNTVASGVNKRELPRALLVLRRLTDDYTYAKVTGHFIRLRTLEYQGTAIYLMGPGICAMFLRMLWPRICFIPTPCLFIPSELPVAIP